MRSKLSSISTLSTVLLVTATGCVEVDSCTDYVSYMCECHGGDEDVDCATLEASYEGASSELQDECSLALDDQEAQDIEESYVCGGSEDTDPPS